MNIPRVSIVMATYNDSRYLADAIESVLKQSYTDWEFIIINDASHDNTDEIIRQYQRLDSRITYIQNAKNLGLAENLNSGVEIARGEYVARLDGDDYWSDATKLKQQIAFLDKNKDHGMVGSFAHAIDINGNKLYDVRYPSHDSEIRKIILKHNCFLHSTVVMRRSTVLKVGKYNNKYRYAEDYDLFLKLGEVSKFHLLPKFFAKYRINPKGTTQSKYWKQMEEVVYILYNYRHSYPNYFYGYMLWNMRKFYPVWFRGAIARDIKKKVPLLYYLSGA